MFMYLFVNVETREVIATRKATRNEKEEERGKIHGERNKAVCTSAGYGYLRSVQVLCIELKQRSGW